MCFLGDAGAGGQEMGAAAMEPRVISRCTMHVTQAFCGELQHVLTRRSGIATIGRSVRPIQELRDLAQQGATSIDVPAVLVAEFRHAGEPSRDFRTSTVSDAQLPIPSLGAATHDVRARVAMLEKSGRNPYDGFLFLGRASTCDVIIRDASISKTHAVIEPAKDGGWYLRDNQSRNGTYKNQVRLKDGERVSLATGDLVVLGSYPLYFLLSADLFRLLRLASSRPPRV